MNVLGIDIGGSGVKGAIVDIESGKLLSEKIRFPTPNKPTPKKIFDGIKSNILDELKWDGNVGNSYRKKQIYHGFSDQSAKWEMILY